MLKERTKTMTDPNHVVENIAKEWVTISNSKKQFTDKEKQYIHEFAVWLDKFMKGEVNEEEE